MIAPGAPMRDRYDREHGQACTVKRVEARGYGYPDMVLILYDRDAAQRWLPETHLTEIGPRPVPVAAHHPEPSPEAADRAGTPLGSERRAHPATLTQGET